MKIKAGRKFHITDLKVKIRTLEAIFGEKKMRSGLNPRTVDKWLKDPRPTPHPDSLRKYFSAVNMKTADMIKSREEFAERAAEIYNRANKSQDRYHARDVIGIYDSFVSEKDASPMFFGQTLKTMEIETLKNDYTYLRGEYHMYHFWQSGDSKDAGNIRRNLVEIYDLDMETGLMRCRIMILPRKNLTPEDGWIYEGWMFNIRNKLFCLFECTKGMLPEIVTFHVFKPSFWPDPKRFVLRGILTALTLEGLPGASNFILWKIRPDHPLREKLGYFTKEEIESEGHELPVWQYIENRVKTPRNILCVQNIEY